MPQDLNSFTVESGYTGNIHFSPLFAVGSWGSWDGTQEWNVTNDINISGGTMYIYGDGYNITAGSWMIGPGMHNITDEGHGQIWRSLSGNITIGSGAVLDGIGLGFASGIGPGSPISGAADDGGGTHGGFGIAPWSGYKRLKVDPYGNATGPTSLGSGGAYNGNGGSGGSGIKLHAESETVTIDGSVTMNGNQRVWNSGSGAGGSIWIKSNTFSGAGAIEAEGGKKSFGGSVYGGGGGRIRLDFSTYNYTGSISLEGGYEDDKNDKPGMAGILTFPNNIWPTDLNLTGDIGLLGGDYGEGNVTNILGNLNTNGYYLYIYGDCLGNSGVYKAYVCFNTTENGSGVWLNVSGDVNISSGSRVLGTALGFPPEVGPGKGGTNLAGSHGGLGGLQSSGIYGSETYPIELGSGGEDSSFANQPNAGGAIKINAQNITLDGIIEMNGDGGTNNIGGGSGGSILLIAESSISGTGNLSASGGITRDSEAGGGGRIALHADIIDFNGNIFNNPGGDSDDDGDYRPGGGGTVYVNATTSITFSGNVSTAVIELGGQNTDGGNITFTDTIITLSGFYNASGHGDNGTITINYTDCSSDFSGATFQPDAIYETECNLAPEDPTPTLVSVDGTNTTSADLNCSATITDTDGDAMNVSVVWYKDGVLNLSLDYNNSYVNGTLFSAILDSGNLSVGDVWKCGLRLHDGTDYSSWVNSSGLTVVSGGTNVWSCTGSEIQLWTNTTCWSLGRLPLGGDDIVFDGTSTTPCNITNNTMPQLLNSFTVESSYTGEIYFLPLFAEGDWTGSNDGTQYWNVTNNIDISGGTMYIYGDYRHMEITGANGNITDEGHGQIWRSLSGNITIGSGAVLDGIGLGFADGGIGPCGSTSGACHGGYEGGYEGGHPYGNASAPTSLGSSGENPGFCKGGSAIKLQTDSGVVEIDG
ncbi:MAG: hypothetical protein DRZ76_03985, partial [Candidatus Nealsonbacteria bacterium]